MSKVGIIGDKDSVMGFLALGIDTKHAMRRILQYGSRAVALKGAQQHFRIQFAAGNDAFQKP